MKRFFALLSVLCLGASMLGAQELPNDPAVRKGQLENGLTYYIRHNANPENRAEFYLATNVGAIQETPDQDGLAHFLEHMCFNGTKNFPGKGILNYLESIGASFGGNVNAGTGVEQTTYMLTNIPLVNESVVDTCLLILHDYSHFVTCDPVEIDNERGVILEERRSRRDASWRLYERSLPYYYGDSKYAGCTLIGSQENLETFKPESLVNFYQTWYRPDLQAVIVVGDIDIDEVEAKLKSTFADIPAPVDPKAKDYIRIPDNVEPVIGILTDPECQNTTWEVLWKSEATPEEINSTLQGLMVDLIKSIVTTVMSERFTDICAQPDAPFLMANLGIGNYCETMEAVSGNVYSKDGEGLTALAAFLSEVEKMKRFGFTDAEIERAKTEILSQYEALAKAAGTRKNSQFINPLLENFFDNYPYMDPEAKYQLVGQILPQLNSQVLNAMLGQLITPENMVVLYNAPEKDGLQHPSEEEVMAVIKAVESADIQANETEEIASEFLDPSTLKGGKVKKASTTILGATQWVLKNGVKVVLYPTDLEKDRIAFNIYRKGGSSLISDDDYASFEQNIFQLFSQYSGLSEFSATQMSKMMAGKQFGVATQISNLYNGFSGSTTVKDLESALQVLYLKYTDPRFDSAEYDQAMQTINAALPNLVNQPNYALQKKLYEVVYDNNPRMLLISEDIVAKASLQTLEREYRKLYADAAGCTMVMVGDFDINEVKPLIEKYIGSLPKGKKAPVWIDRNMDVSTKNVVEDFSCDMKTPKATVAQVFRSEIPYSIENGVRYEALSYIMNMVYTETLREDEGGTYGASAAYEIFREPKEYGIFQVVFETNNQQADRLRELCVSGLKKVAEEGPTPEMFDKAVKNLEKSIPESRVVNSYWMNCIRKYIDYGDNFDADYESAVKALTPEKVKAAAAELVGGNFLEIVMRPTSDVEAD